MAIPTEMIGSIPRPLALLEAAASFAAGTLEPAVFELMQQRALQETIDCLERTGSPILSDGEQTKPSFVTYPLAGLENLAADGVAIPFADGHERRLPRLVEGPFRYGAHAAGYVTAARSYTKLPLKQAVISASALSLLYPAACIAGYTREEFEEDLVREAEADIRGALDAGAAVVQIDFTEARLSLKLDPSGDLLRSFVALNNRVLERFTLEERLKLGVHVCPGGDRDSTHSADIDYAGLLPTLFEMNVGRFYLQLASEPDRLRVLRLIRGSLQPHHRVFVGVIDPIDRHIETAEQVCARVLEAATFLPLDQLGTTDDCGFSPFGDDVSTARETAFAKIRARVEGTEMAARQLRL